ncbi:MAG TPA: response regulator, partial [Deferrisomatales bacterium]|nr:response regulator [Deferrisomatales bacterium]
GHGGGIRVYSEPGRGTTIKVLFPAAEAAPDEALPAKPSPEPGGGAAPGGLVLVVDDDPSVREVATHMLGAAGYRVIVARDGQEAVDTYRERQAEVCLVLLDMTMPRKSGEEAYREMRAIRPDVNVILSSGYNEQEAVRKFSGKELAGFIQKPYRAKQLLELVARVCGQGA